VNVVAESRPTLLRKAKSSEMVCGDREWRMKRRQGLLVLQLVLSVTELFKGALLVRDGFLNNGSDGVLIGSMFRFLDFAKTKIVPLPKYFCTLRGAVKS
jgi:hypothetical protein